MAKGADPNYAAALETLARIGDKWTVMVVAALWQGPLRYNEIQRGVEGISQRMLTLTLKGLEQDGLVERTLFPTVPPRVDYELTELGRSLIVPLHALYEWFGQKLLIIPGSVLCRLQPGRPWPLSYLLRAHWGQCGVHNINRWCLYPNVVNFCQQLFSDKRGNHRNM
jgi:DNA-binding HxlR family transcriptional regulator